MPAPASTTTSKPACMSFPAVSGTSATLRSPGAVARTTPTLIATDSTGAAGGRLSGAAARMRRVESLLWPGGALLHAPRTSVAVRRGDARVVRHPAAGRDRAHLLRRA